MEEREGGMAWEKRGPGRPELHSTCIATVSFYRWGSVLSTKVQVPDG